MPKAKLEDVSNVTGRSFFPVSKPIINIGRSLKNDFVIKKNTVSNRHAAIEQKPDGHFIVDLNSSNKTQLNGVELDPNSPHRLNDGDEIRIHTFPFIFKLEEIEPPPPPPDHDETIFFDSSSLMDEVKEGEFVQPVRDYDHREETGGKTLLGEEEKAVRRKKTAATTETTKIGNYEVIKLLGKGGFGSVWKAKAADGQPVAIKVLNPDVLENNRAVRKFFHEAINLSKMDHPNICRFIDFFPHEGNYAIIMDFVQGTDLQDLLKSQNGPLPFDTARLIAAQSLDAFHYAHQQQVLHRVLISGIN